MKNAKTQPYYKCLLYDKYCVTNISIEEVKKFFSTEDIFVFSFSEIENSKQLLLELN